MGVRVKTEQKDERRRELCRWFEKMASTRPGSLVYQALWQAALQESEMSIPEMFTWLSLNKSDQYLSKRVKNCGPRIQQRVHEWLDSQFVYAIGAEPRPRDTYKPSDGSEDYDALSKVIETIGPLDPHDALSKVIETIGPLDPHDARRVLQAAAVFLGINLD